MSIKEQFQLAQEYINEEQYDKAREILKQIDHPTAQNWLNKLDEYLKEVVDRGSHRRVYEFLVLSALIICILWTLWRPIWLAPPLLEYTIPLLYILPFLISIIIAIGYIEWSRYFRVLRFIVFAIVLYGCALNALWLIPSALWTNPGSASSCHQVIHEDHIEWNCTFYWLLSANQIILEGPLGSPFVRIVSSEEISSF